MIVVGGGLVGCSAAYYLAREGLGVTVFDSGDLAEGASGACEGFLSLQSKPLGEALAMARESLAEYAALGEALGADMELRRAGGMTIVDRPEGMSGARRLCEALTAVGVNAELLSPREARRLAPVLCPDIAGAVYCAEEAMVNPWQVVRALAAAAADRGARFVRYTRVLRILASRGRVTGVVTTRACGSDQEADWSGGYVVLAAGVGSPALGETVGVDIPVRPRRGQVLVTEKAHATLKPFLLGPSYVSAKLGPPPPEGGAALALAQTAAGNFLIGGTREFVGHDLGTEPRGIAALAREACSLAPGIRHLAVIRSFAGLRPYVDAHVPIIERVRDPEGLIIATGHGGDGVCLAPATGKRVAALVLA